MGQHILVDNEVTFLKINRGLFEVVSFVIHRIGRQHVGQAFTILVPVPLIGDKKFIIVIDDQVTEDYVLGYVRREEEIESLKFYIALKPSFRVVNKVIDVH